MLVTKIGFKPVVIAGLLFVAAGLFLFAQISVDGVFTGDILIPSLLAAVGPRLLLRAGDDRRHDGHRAATRRAWPAA